MLQSTEFEIASAAFGNVRSIQSTRDERIESFIIPKRGSERSLSLCRDLVNEWQPDLIHIHGTESAYGLLTARRMVTYPTMISIQGLLGPYSEWYHYFGNRTLLDIIRMHRWLDIPSLRGQWMGYLDFRKRSKRECEIIQGNKFFIGRSSWDLAHTRALNPSANYFHGGELLRGAFWQKSWELERIRRHRIIFTKNA